MDPVFVQRKKVPSRVHFEITALQPQLPASAQPARLNPHEIQTGKQLYTKFHFR